MKVVRDTLLTSRGLRSLSPQHPEYRSRYLGDPVARDSSYHQGTVWAWLLGPYISAIIRFEGKRGRTRARKIIEGFKAHLLEAGLGTISEIFDGQSPHVPRGCPAQAWSVAEVLRSYVETFGNNQPLQNDSEENRE